MWVARTLSAAAAMTQAAATGADFHLWWHPHNFGLHTERNLAMLDAVLDHFGTLRERLGMRSANMHDCVADKLGSA